MVGEDWSREQSQRSLKSQMNQRWLNYKIESSKWDHNGYSKHTQAGRVGVDSNMRDDPREEIMKGTDVCGRQKSQRGVPEPQLCEK